VNKTNQPGLKIGLALGGGGARGYTHLGILKALDEAGIHIDLFAGTSMGALAAAMYLQKGSAPAAIQHLQNVLKKQRSVARMMSYYIPDPGTGSRSQRLIRRLMEVAVINRAIHTEALLPNKYLVQAVEALVSPGRIEDLPLTAVATDLVSGRGVAIRHGDLRRAIIASSAIPGFFPPVRWERLLLTDGEVTDLVPVDVCRYMGADVVIAVEVLQDTRPRSVPPRTLDVLLRSISLTVQRLGQAALGQADIVIRPVKSDVQWADFHRLKGLIEEGESAAKESLPKIREALEGRTARREFDQKEFLRTHIVT
jgi:NTE family protein